MVTQLDDVWSSRDFPVLVEVTRRVDAGEAPIAVSAVADALEMPTATVVRAMHALTRRGLVAVKWFGGGDNGWISTVAGKAYLLTGLHPSGDDAVSRLVDALRQAADLTPDPAEKSRLRALADGALGVGREVLGGVLVAIASRGMLGA